LPKRREQAGLRQAKVYFDVHRFSFLLILMDSL
jgi:hypothetical protein